MPLSTGIAEIVQVTSCGEIFNVGSTPLIHGTITTSPANRGTVGPAHGSFEGTRSRNGKLPDGIHFYGFTANVSYRPKRTLSQTLMYRWSNIFVAGSGKSVLWYFNPLVA